MQHLSQEYDSRSLHHPSVNNTVFSDQNMIQQMGDEDSDDDSSKPGKRSGRRKIKIEYIEDKSRRHITFSKRKAGIMKKAYELSTLTGTQVLLLVVSETGLVYTFTTPKLQPLVTKPEGKNLIQACLNAPEATSGSDQHTAPHPPTSPKPNQTSATNMIKSEPYSSSLHHHGSNNVYSQQQQQRDNKVPLSQTSSYHHTSTNESYSQQQSYHQQQHPHHQPHSYGPPSTPYPSSYDTNHTYPSYSNNNHSSYLHPQGSHSSF
ncbi:uncharacterized protein BX664DRAFT_319540 [Halteromyces radiatus]|uniref:uncharacterized protein n=1 Tax=Halteromyces radiatus TaxID=101107 RepID=UPI00221FA36C|nr:uncharacterized protein BX664DRAFT_319540 [Halteromyces radiatus]KAI8098762.1 hypothetical protein BX664DRAFT_319540 [Halteromyces radiatus]